MYIIYYQFLASDGKTYDLKIRTDRPTLLIDEDYEVLFYPNTSERSRANSFEVPMGKTYRDIATGVYIYMIQVYDDRNIPVFSDSEKMILLK